MVFLMLKILHKMAKKSSVIKVNIIYKIGIFMISRFWADDTFWNIL